ncbi:MAG: hypothetical protein CSB47_09910 [Proteobacteria bacterium]|nr:MAG: hypothetical protein CSB47_09910 [Pseudomonadota bacterium]
MRSFIQFLFLSLFLSLTVTVFAKDPEKGPDKSADAPPQAAVEAEKAEVPELTPEEIKAAEEKKKQQDALESLESTQKAIEEKVKEQRSLQKKLKSADATLKPDIQAELDVVTADLKKLKKSFEQVATGGINLEAFGQAEEKFNWEEELVLITQPVLKGLKDLTEKPRKTEHLRSIIINRNLQSKEIDRAIESVESRLALKPAKAITAKLQETLKAWKKKKEDNQREIELAEFQLESLLGNNEAWQDNLVGSMKSFFEGRGTTLLIALVASVLVWAVMKLLLWLVTFRKRAAAKDGKKQISQTRYRVAYYLYRALTTLLIVITIVVVLYTRDDLLLLAILIIVFVGLALAMRELLPRYIHEARILLNLGSIREGERVFYKGVPWQVAHINVHSIFRNPELHGVLRVPLSEMTELNSRPLSRDEAWFPSKKGDLVLMPDGYLAEVLVQTPETIEVQTKGGMRTAFPTATFYETSFHNLTRGGQYGVASVFGIDYSHLDISLTLVPEVLRDAVQAGLKSAGLGEHVLNILVDFKQANSSSLDYLIYVNMHSRVASSYFKIERVIQQSCTRACNENNWGIPFPQMTVHRAT